MIEFVTGNHVVLKPHEDRQPRTSLVVLVPYFFGNGDVGLASERLKIVLVYLYSVKDIIWTI